MAEKEGTDEGEAVPRLDNVPSVSSPSTRAKPLRTRSVQAVRNSHGAHSSGGRSEPRRSATEARRGDREAPDAASTFLLETLFSEFVDYAEVKVAEIGSLGFVRI